jgi:hypothetical protein
VAASTAPEISTLPDGLTLVGQFLGSQQEADRTSPDGERTFKGKYTVTVLVGQQTMRVEYKDRAQCMEIVGEDVESIPRMERIALHVGVRSAQGYTFYYGRSAR